MPKTGLSALLRPEDSVLVLMITSLTSSRTSTATTADRGQQRDGSGQSR
jgi:hypothetical protein